MPHWFEDNHRQAQGFYIPDDNRHQVEPKFIRFVQGANPHAEGTQGQGFPLFIHHLYAPTDYEDTDLPWARCPSGSLPPYPTTTTCTTSSSMQPWNTTTGGSALTSSATTKLKTRSVSGKPELKKPHSGWSAHKRNTFTHNTTWKPLTPTNTLPIWSALTAPKIGSMMTTQVWSFPSNSWHNEEGGMSEVADNLRTRRGMVKPAATSGSGLSSVRREGELAQMVW
jgi:hypothetical protein